LPSIFSLYGTLKADTKDFENSLKRADQQLSETRNRLNSVEKASIALGDTSATVARRYDKLNFQIIQQRERLTEAAQAFVSGDIKAKQFAQAIIAADKATAGFNSRLLDMKARTEEISATGLTHFQNQIAGGVTGGQQGHSLINFGGARPLQGLGPVLQGLGARQFGLDETILNILIVAAREAGIIKVATEGTAAAEVAFSAASQKAAASQAIVATESEATAVAMNSAATGTTVLGASLVAVGAVLATAAVAAGAAYKLSKDIREESEKRLKNEEAIAAALNKQYLSIKDLNDERAKAQGDRQFGSYVQGAPLPSLLSERADLQRQFDETAKQAIADLNERARLAGALPSLLAAKVQEEGPDKGKPVYLQPDKAIEAAQKQRAEQLKALDAKIYEEQQSSAAKSKALTDQMNGQQLESFQDFTKRINDNYKQRADAEKKYFEDRQKLIEKAKKDAQDFANAVIKANEKIAQAQKQVLSDFAQTLSNRVQAADYRSQAAILRGQSPGDQVQARLDAINGGSGYSDIRDLLSARNPQQSAIRDKAIIDATSDFSKLNDSQREIAAAARERFARELDKAKEDGLEALKENTAALRDLLAKGGLQLKIQDETNGRITQTKKATPAATAQKYGDTGWVKHL